MIEEIKEKYGNGTLKKDFINKTIKNIKHLQEDVNAFVTILDNIEINVDDTLPLSGIPYAAKDNFSTKGILSTGSSNTLKNYIPVFDATVIEKLKSSGAVLVGKTVMDELGMGGEGITGHTGITLNPWDKTCIAGGSSCGSAAAVASGVVPFSLGSDTGDSVRKPAAYCGIVGYKPTYGLISRYGLFPFASSLDHVGVLSRCVKDAGYVTNIIKGKDKKDMTSLDSKYIDLTCDIDIPLVNKKMFYIKELCAISSYENPSEELKENLNIFHNTLDIIRKMGVIIEEVSFDLDLLAAIFPSYLCISSAEATSNFSNLTGIIYGPRGEGRTINDMIKDHRTKGFSSLIKRRFIIGSYVLNRENQEKYFLNACRVRRLITDKINEILKGYDALIMPSSSGISRKINEERCDSDVVKALDNNLIIGNFGGFPSITIPNGFINNMPTGINFTGKVLDDANILNIANKIEEVLGFKGQISKENK